MKYHILLLELLFGFKLEKISINSLGLSIEFYGYKTRNKMKKVITYFSGPMINIILGIIIYILPIQIELKMQCVYTNMILAIFNLLPIMPLDGGKILKELMVYKVGNKNAVIFMNKLTKFILIIMTLIYSIAILKLKNFAIFLLIIYLWYLKLQEDKKIETMLRAYNIMENY